jgi:hypothetical protein
VDLSPLLERIHSLESLRGLLVALGHSAIHAEAPGVAGRRTATNEGTAFVLGIAGTFPWFGVEGPDAERLARRVAKRLATRGRTAGVLALDPAARRLGLAVAYDGLPSLGVDLAHPSASALASLRRLEGVGPGGALAYAAQVAGALAGQAVGRRFFRAFKGSLERMEDALRGQLRAEDRRNLALLHLTRVLFLYFVQAKGWLDGRERFLADAVDRCLTRRRDIHRDLLRPLFFGTLNRPPDERSRIARAFGAVPFLNGGLFEPHPLERSRAGDVPNPVWRDAFDEVFERFHFVVSEHDRPNLIAPDMLGRVFEGVMAPASRHASGSYYTPAALVATVIDSALAAHVAGRLACPQGEAERRLDQRDPQVVQLLNGVTILDPAAGSGAFLLGALDRLATIAAPDGRASVSVRRRILQRSLFGVDQSAAAIRLAELRLWLALIADDPESRPERVDPLPNLDCLVRQGDSLFEPAHGARLPAPEAELAAEVVEVRRRLVAATGATKRALARALGAAECRVASSSLRKAEAETGARIAECLALGRSVDLFGQPRGADPEVRRCLAEHRGTLRALRSARRIVTRDRELPWFHYQSHFADVFSSGGFDLVVGNPPWLRAEHVPRETRRRLAGRYRWWRGGGSGFGHQPDLAVAFLERSVELATPGGVIALLIPAKLATAGYGASSRHALAATMTVICAADLAGRPEAAFDATVYPLALVVRKAGPPAGHRVFTSLGARPSPAHRRGTIPQTRLQGGGPWILSAGAADAIATRVRREHPSVAERFRCQLGVKTGANELFLDPPSGLPPGSIRWALRGRDLRPFQARRRVRLLWTHGPLGEPLERLPPDVAAFLAPHHAMLCRRADYNGGPAWTLFRTRAATSAHRVVWADLARRLTACALTGTSDREHIPLNTCYVAAAASADAAERLASWLNAGPVRAIANIGAMPAAGHFRRFSAGVVSALPLPASVLDDATLSTLAAAGRRGECVQEELDEAAARHLGLSARDRRKLAHDVDDSTPNRS